LESKPRKAISGDGRIRDATPGEDQRKPVKPRTQEAPVAVAAYPGSPAWRDSTPGVEGGETPQFSRLFMREQANLGSRFVIEAGDGLPMGKNYVGCEMPDCGWTGRNKDLADHMKFRHEDEKPPLPDIPVGVGDAQCCHCEWVGDPGKLRAHVAMQHNGTPRKQWWAEIKAGIRKPNPKFRNLWNKWIEKHPEDARPEDKVDGV
jgi:hypothetical protein